MGYPLRLPPESPPKPYDPLVRVGSLIYGSGNTSMDRHAGIVYAGKVGADVGMDEAQERARIALINALAALKAELGDLEHIRRFVRMTGYVHGTPDFERQADVMNAASIMLREAFLDRGHHARSAIGVAQLPGGATVEVELIVEVEP